tara:strand:- start:801 stop:980 length:180 start_codon:yes stop_codon:yes gene_type:complete
MHVRWQNCPKAWAGQYQGKEKEPTVVLEAVADYSTYIWYSFFGTYSPIPPIIISAIEPL